MDTWFSGQGFHAAVNLSGHQGRECISSVVPTHDKPCKSHVKPWQTLKPQTLPQVGFDDAMRQRNITELSGGWKMKLALARAMLLNADILLLDGVGGRRRGEECI